MAVVAMVGCGESARTQTIREQMALASPRPPVAPPAPESPAPTQAQVTATPAQTKAPCDLECKTAILRRAHDACVADMSKENPAPSCSTFTLADIEPDEKRLQALADACTKECRSEWPAVSARIRAAEKLDADYPKIDLAFRKCMIEADKQRTARVAEAFDRRVYQDMISQAAKKCWKPSGCDRLEGSKYRCDYGD